MKNYKVEIDYVDWIALVTMIGNYSGMIQGISLSIENGEISKNLSNKDIDFSAWFDEIRDRAILKESK